MPDSPHQRKRPIHSLDGPCRKTQRSFPVVRVFHALVAPSLSTGRRRSGQPLLSCEHRGYRADTRAGGLVAAAARGLGLAARWFASRFAAGRLAAAVAVHHPLQPADALLAAGIRLAAARLRLATSRGWLAARRLGLATSGLAATAVAVAHHFVQQFKGLRVLGACEQGEPGGGHDRDEDSALHGGKTPFTGETKNAWGIWEL